MDQEPGPGPNVLDASHDRRSTIRLVPATTTAVVADRPTPGGAPTRRHAGVFARVFEIPPPCGSRPASALGSGESRVFFGGFTKPFTFLVAGNSLPLDWSCRQVLCFPTRAARAARLQPKRGISREALRHRLARSSRNLGGDKTLLASSLTRSRDGRLITPTRRRDVACRRCSAAPVMLMTTNVLWSTPVPPTRENRCDRVPDHTGAKIPPELDGVSCATAVTRSPITAARPSHYFAVRAVSTALCAFEAVVSGVVTTFQSLGLLSTPLLHGAQSVPARRDPTIT